jgi:hypothetical protein
MPGSRANGLVQSLLLAKRAMTNQQLGIGISALVGLAMFGGGCADVDNNSDEVGETSQNVGLCGNTPLAPVCNLPRCTADGWVDWPIAAGSSCQVAGVAGKCDGGETEVGDIDPLQIGKCVVPSGSLNPQYYVLGVVYAPPGFDGNRQLASSVTYANGSSMSHDTKVSNSFKQGVSVTASAEIPALAATVLPLSGSATAGYSVTDSTSGGLTVQSSLLNVLGPWFGPAVDGINHDDDEIFLWLNPRVSFAERGSITLWTLGLNPDTYAGTTADVQFVKVGWLRGTEPWDTGTLRELTAHNIGPAQYAELLSLDPFANGGTTVDLTRFQDTGGSFPYELDAPPMTVTMTGSDTTTNGTAHTEEKTVSATLTAGSDATWTKLSVTGSWDWTLSTAVTDTTTTTESASATVTGHSPAYNGPSNVRVYYDMLFKTFMFQFIQVPPVVVGTISGLGNAHLGISLVDGGTTYHTITDSTGNYSFSSVPSGAGTLRVGTQSRAIQVPTGRLSIRENFTTSVKGL